MDGICLFGKFVNMRHREKNNSGASRDESYDRERRQVLLIEFLRVNVLLEIVNDRHRVDEIENGMMAVDILGTVAETLVEKYLQLQSVYQTEIHGVAQITVDIRPLVEMVDFVILEDGMMVMVLHRLIRY